MQDAADLAYSWSPDAKFVRRADGSAVAIDFVGGARLVLPPVDAAHVGSISGLTFPTPLDPNFPATIRNTLIEQGFILPADESADREVAIREAIRAALDESTGLIIMPTEKCNLRCTYCYESFEKGRMAPARVEALSTAIAARIRQARRFSLGFFGGEPLLCADIVLRLLDEAFRACAARSVPFSASMSTNAVLLTQDLFERLVRRGLVFFQITLDGDRELHNQQRVTVKGKGTFDEIVASLRRMAASPLDFGVGLRCNVHERDMGRVLDLFESGKLAFLKDDTRFIVDVHRIWKSDRLGLNTADSEGCLSSMKEGMDRHLVNSELSRRGIRNTGRDEVSGLLAKACYAGKKNWFVVGADLSLYKCTVVFDNPKNRVGHIGPDGAFLVDEALNRLWTGSNAATDSGCAGCYLRVPCGGVACPLSRFTSGSKSCLELRDPANLQRFADNIDDLPIGSPAPTAGSTSILPDRRSDSHAQ